jgi:hypothetical protein
MASQPRGFNDLVRPDHHLRVPSAQARTLIPIYFRSFASALHRKTSRPSSPLSAPFACMPRVIASLPPIILFVLLYSNLGLSYLLTLLLLLQRCLSLHLTTKTAETWDGRR